MFGVLVKEFRLGRRPRPAGAVGGGRAGGRRRIDRAML